MDKAIKILRIVFIGFFILWGIIWFSIRADRMPIMSMTDIDRIIVFLANTPREVKEFLLETGKDDHLEKPIHDIGKLCAIGKFPQDVSINQNLYLLHYRYMGGSIGNVLLQNIKTGEIAFQWTIPLKRIMKDINEIEDGIKNKYREGAFPLDLGMFFPKNVSVIQASAPIMTSDSSLLFHPIFGYLYKIDKYSNLIWRSDKLAHHSIELDAQGNIWTCSKDHINSIANEYKFWDDALLCLARRCYCDKLDTSAGPEITRVFLVCRIVPVLVHAETGQPLDVAGVVGVVECPRRRIVRHRRLVEEIVNADFARRVFVLGVEKIKADRVDSHRILRGEQTRRPVPIERV
jgi:hypothetical protein